MSGGHWDYGQRAADAGVYTPAFWKLMEALEHELDWGLSGDTCLECAKIRVAEAVVAYLEAQAWPNKCSRCAVEVERKANA